MKYSNGRKVFSVSELNETVKLLLESDERFFDLCVQGELSNYKIYPSGHHYFTMKDAESSLRCVMFRSSAQRLRFRPENGLKVSAVGALRVYPRDGAYQLYCSELIPAGAGDLQLAYEQLKKRLQEEGLFDLEAKKPLPSFPDRIAIVTSSAGAAIHDMIRIFGRRWPMTKLILLPVRVQGAEAPAEIADAICYANEFHLADLIITGRGGGSLEDLWAFNDERVARAIFASEIPVISAVGHEPDVTISDFVADRRAATPSNAAEIAVPDCTEVADALKSLELRLTQAQTRLIHRNRQNLENLNNRRVLRDAGSFVDMKRLEVDRLQENLCSCAEQILLRRESALSKIASALDAMSPLKVLARGYTVATDREGLIVRSVKQLVPGDPVRLLFTDGVSICRIEELEENTWTEKNRPLKRQ